MIIPEPIPLPKPMASEASKSVLKPEVNGISSSAVPMMSIDGTAMLNARCFLVTCTSDAQALL